MLSPRTKTAVAYVARCAAMGTLLDIAGIHAFWHMSAVLAIVIFLSPVASPLGESNPFR